MLYKLRSKLSSRLHCPLITVDNNVKKNQHYCTKTTYRSIFPSFPAPFHAILVIFGGCCFLQETQRLLSEPGTFPLIEFGWISASPLPAFGCRMLFLIPVSRSVRACSAGDQRLAVGGEHALLQCHDPWPNSVAI